MARLGGKEQRKAAREAQRIEQQARAERALGIIERAFDGVPPPDADHRTLFQAAAWDGHRVVDQQRDHKGRWQDLPDAHVHACPNALYHLDAQGMRYYLPALMSYVVRGVGVRRPGAHDALSFMLMPDTSGHKDHQHRLLSGLTLAQREAIVAFLEHIGAPPAAQEPWRRVVALGDDPKWFRKFY